MEKQVFESEKTGSGKPKKWVPVTVTDRADQASVSEPASVAPSKPPSGRASKHVSELFP